MRDFQCCAERVENHHSEGFQMIQGAVQADNLGRVRRPIGIKALLEWAFATEFASVDFEDVGTLVGHNYPGVGTEYIMMETARLGCRVDGGGRSDPHPDADLVASALAVLPESCGGRRMAVSIAEWARSRCAPDPLVGLTPVIEPVAWRGNRHGSVAVTKVTHKTQERVRGRLVEREWRVCPVRVLNAPQRIHAARREYLLWYGALMELRSTFQIHNNLSAWAVNDAMPPRTPWKK